MKVKYYTTIAALAAFACAAQAEAATIYGSLDEADATEIKAAGENPAVDLYPNDSAPAVEAFFKGNDNTVRSLTSGNKGQIHRRHRRLLACNPRTLDIRGNLRRGGSRTGGFPQKKIDKAYPANKRAFRKNRKAFFVPEINQEFIPI